VRVVKVKAASCQRFSAPIPPLLYPAKGRTRAFSVTAHSPIIRNRTATIPPTIPAAPALIAEPRRFSPAFSARRQDCNPGGSA